MRLLARCRAGAACNQGCLPVPGFPSPAAQTLTATRTFSATSPPLASQKPACCKPFCWPNHRCRLYSYVIVVAWALTYLPQLWTVTFPMTGPLTLKTPVGTFAFGPICPCLCPPSQPPFWLISLAVLAFVFGFALLIRTALLALDTTDVHGLQSLMSIRIAKCSP